MGTLEPPDADTQSAMATAHAHDVGAAPVVALAGRMEDPEGVGDELVKLLGDCCTTSRSSGKQLTLCGLTGNFRVRDNGKRR